jgi:hypothetical protein
LILRKQFSLTWIAEFYETISAGRAA